MQNSLSDVLNNYVSTRALVNGLAKRVKTPDQNALIEEIPKKINAHLAKRGLAHLYKVEGSFGKGNMARVPWVGIFKTSVTKNAENGFYIVLLFAEDMSGCFLSLNQGITAVERLYTKNFALKKMREAGLRAAQHLERHPESIIGTIALQSTGDLARAYEAAAIESFPYNGAYLPTDAIFFGHFDHLLSQYAKLATKFGSDLYSLFSVSEDEFQQVALEKAALTPGDKGFSEPLGGIARATATVLGTKGFTRSPHVAAEAIRSANFLCEIDTHHWTFTSRARKKNYVEAHHLIPISQQDRFEYSLDVVANVVALCATCHRLLHYGTAEEKKDILKGLLDVRRPQLQEKLIDVAPRDFMKFYGDVLSAAD